MKKYKSTVALCGWATPQILIQISPFRWGIGVGFGSRKIGVCLGPLSVSIWFRVDEKFGTSYNQWGK